LEAEKRIDDKDFYTVMSHFYRGELGRMMAWRQRLDNTTNWAIVSTTAVVTLAFGHPGITHFLFMFANFLAALFLIIEARRYRYYDAFRARVRMLEAHLLMPAVMKDSKLIQGDWQRLLSSDLLMPTYKMSRKEAIGRRLYRNYIWIFCILLFGWILKVLIFHPSAWDSFEGFFQALHRHQPLPVFLFWLMVVIFYGIMAYLYYIGFKLRNVAGEFQTKTLRSSKWRI
jgi:uncharacterized membrane protein